jgi:hypothetical protein
MPRHRVARAAEIPDRGGLIVDVDGVEVGHLPRRRAVYGLRAAPDRATVTRPRERERVTESPLPGTVE